MEKTEQQKHLIVFDFDHTIIEQNSDTTIFELFTDKEAYQKLKTTYQDGGWTKYMNDNIGYMYNNLGVKADDLKRVQQSEKVELALGMKDLFAYLNSEKEKFDVIIASDSNTYFIDWILEKFGLRNQIKQVFTNIGKIENDLLKVDHHHKHECEKCPPNICKQKVLSDYLKSYGINYKSIQYCGDGGNDYCPLNIMGENDIVFVRQGYRLEKLVNKESCDIKCQKQIYKDANEIVETLKKRV